MKPYGHTESAKTKHDWSQVNIENQKLHSFATFWCLFDDVRILEY